MRKIILLIIFMIILMIRCNCENMYYVEIKGTRNLLIHVAEKEWSRAIESNYIVYIPHDHDITNSNGEHYRIVLQKDSTEGKLILRIVRIVNPFILFPKETTLFECETEEPNGICKFDGYF